jgi:hypothetical protein
MLKGSAAAPAVSDTPSQRGPGGAARRCRRIFLRHFPRGFRDETYLAWERDYKWQAHERWMAGLAPAKYDALLGGRRYEEIARVAIAVESRTNLLFSFEKMALRDAVRTREGARAFARGLFALLHGDGHIDERFAVWCDTVAGLPRRQTRVLTWPVLTVFPFIAQPSVHMYLKPTVTRVAAEAYDYPFEYASRPSWRTYASLLDFAATVRRDVRDLKPRDMIDLQSFIWVQSSDEY